MAVAKGVCKEKRRRREKTEKQDKKKHFFVVVATTPSCVIYYIRSNIAYMNLLLPHKNLYNKNREV